MAQSSIRAPGVDVRQVFEGRNPPTFTAPLQSCCVGVNYNIAVQLEVGVLTTLTTGGQVVLPIPTGDAQIVSQVIDEDTVEVFLVNDDGEKYKLTPSDYELALSPALNTITFVANPDLSRTVVSGIAERLSNIPAGTGSSIGQLTDEEAQFTAVGVQSGDILTLEDDPDSANATQFSLDDFGNSLQFRVIDIDSDTQFTCMRIDGSVTAGLGFVAAENDVSYTITRSATSGSGTILISYRARRLDGINTYYEFESVDQVIQAFGPPVPENPISLGCVLALTNTSTTVSAVKAGDDTLASHIQALEILENKEVYGIVPLTSNQTIHAAYVAHVDAMSAPERKKERVAFINRDMPAYVTRTNISGTNLDSPVYFSAEYSTGASPGTTRLTIPVTDDNSNNIDLTDTRVGDIVRVKVVSGGTGNDVKMTNGYLVDNDQVILQIVDKSVSPGGGGYVDVIGEIESVISSAGIETVWDVGSSFKAAISTRNFTSLQGAEYYGSIGESFDNRRIILTFPDLLSINITRQVTDDTDYSVTTQTNREDDVPGYFMGASISGQVSQIGASQPHTNLPILGLVGVTGSNDALSETALDTMATGGVWIAIQEKPGSNVITRHQLTTAAGDIKTREFSIVKAVDFSAKIFRAYLKDLIGSNNITKRFLRNVVQPTAQAALALLVDGDVIATDSQILGIQQSETEPDTVLIDVDIVNLFPANRIRVTLFV